MNVQVRSKVWLEGNGAPLLGDGSEKILRLIDRTGSISAAAKEMGLTYPKARGHLKSIEQALDTSWSFGGQEAPAASPAPCPLKRSTCSRSSTLSILRTQ